jgi:hypothetical protein
MRGAILSTSPIRLHAVVFNCRNDTSPWCGTYLSIGTTSYLPYLTIVTTHSLINVSCLFIFAQVETSTAYCSKYGSWYTLREIWTRLFMSLCFSRKPVSYKLATFELVWSA